LQIIECRLQDEEVLYIFILVYFQNNVIKYMPFPGVENGFTKIRKGDRIMKNLQFAIVFFAVYPFAASGTAFTLSDSALMSLDYNYYNSTSCATITNIIDEPGPGVRFEILYSDPLKIKSRSPNLYWTSCIYGGRGELAGRDISTFDSFALKFTLDTAGGVSIPDATGPVIVGALINSSQTDTYTYQPHAISFDDPPNPEDAVSVTSTGANKIRLIGFVCSIPDWWYTPATSPWDPAGARISLLVEAAPNAVVIVPEPASFILLALGGMFLRKSLRINSNINPRQ
jgi:hypothetical protein